MINVLNFWSRPHLRRTVSQSMMVGVISTLSVLIGWVPGVQVSPFDQALSLTLDRSAHAQQSNGSGSLSADDLRNYARSVLEIEPIRLEAYDEIKRISGNRNVPAIACHQPDTLRSLSRNVRQIAVDYCNRSVEIVQRNNLDIGRFNIITSNLQSDTGLRQRIQEELVRLQRNDGAQPSSAP